MDTSKSLWGDLPLAETVRTPLIILREQATILTQMTNGLLTGVVSKGRFNLVDDPYDLPFEDPASPPIPMFRATLSIEAPALDGYIFQVLQTDYQLALLYPISVYDVVSKTNHTCADENEFLAVVGVILSSEGVRHAIGMLLSQSRSEQQLKQFA